MPELRSDFISDYDGLAGDWWDPRGPLAPLGWIAKARAEFVPEPETGNPVLLDVACGGGLFGPHLAGRGYRVIGVDLSLLSLREARQHGYDAVAKADITRLPFADGAFDVVAAGQCLEHVLDPFGVVRELCRVLRPGGTLILDTIADTTLARFVAVTVVENLPVPGRPPHGTHDHRLFVNRERLRQVAREGGVELRLLGLAPHIGDGFRYLAGRRADVRMVPIRSTALLYLGVGTKW